jgi:hypothetical protein
MGILLMPLCKTNLIDNIANIGYSNMLIATPADSIGVLWAYIIIYVIINLGVWGMLFWPIYRPVSLFIRSSSSSNVNKQYNTQQTSEISTGQLSNAVAPQYLWDLKGINSSSARAAFRWGVFITSLAGLPPVYSF